MSTSPRRSQLRIAYSSSGAVQAGFGVGNWLANGAIDKLFSLLPGSEPRLEYISKDDEIFTCTGQDILDELVLARSIRISFELQIDIETLETLLFWGFGAQAGADITMLTETEFQPSPTTFIWGHDDAAGTALKLGDLVLDELTLNGEVTGRINCTVSFRGHGGPTDATGYDFPACDDGDPIRLSDGDFLLDGNSLIDDLRRIEFAYKNNLLFNDDPFTAASIDVTRMERGDQREELFTFTIYGQPGDANHTAALAKTKMPSAGLIGDGTPGILIEAASAILKQGDGPGHDGEAARSVLGLVARPVKISGDADTPVKATVLP
jgi:hypothetical protein